jgi:hypothetical protein
MVKKKITMVFDKNNWETKMLIILHQQTPRNSHFTRKHIPQVAACHDGGDLWALFWIHLLQMAIGPSINTTSFRVQKPFTIAN